MSRRALVLTLIALLLALLALATFGAQQAQARLDRALARTEALQSVHFEMRATVSADSPLPEQAPAGGALNQDLRASGDIAFPDRLHLVAPLGPPAQEEARELIVIGERAWSRMGGIWRRVVAIGPSNDPRALLEILRGPGLVRFAGYSLTGLVPTYHVRIDLDAAALADRQSRTGQIGSSGLVGSGRFDVFIGLFDDRIYRQEADIEERSGELASGSGLYRLRTTYAVDYSAFDRPVEIREPAGN